MPVTQTGFDEVRVGRAPSRTSEAGSFGKWLREQRRAKGWTGEQLAEAAGTASGVISNLERGLRRPSRDMVGRLATALFGDPASDPDGYAAFEAVAIRAAWPTGEPSDPLQPAIYDYLRRVKGFDPKTDYTEEQLDDLRHIADVMIAGWLDGIRAERR